MTLSQQLLKTRLKPLQNGLAKVFLSSLMVISCSTHAADNPQTSATLTGSPIQNSTPANHTITAQATTPQANPLINAGTGANNPATASTTVTTTVTAPAVVTPTAPINKNAPFDQPNMTDDEILNYASHVASSVYSYDFKNYPNQLPMNQQYFTTQGWKAFMAALEKSNNLNVVQNRKLVASATVTGKPTLLKKGVRNGVYTWEVQVPVLASYESESRIIKQNLLVTLLIIRANTPSGVGISHFVATIIPATAPPVTQTVTPGTLTTSTPVTITTPGATTTTTTPNTGPTSSNSNTGNTTNVAQSTGTPGVMTTPGTTYGGMGGTAGVSTPSGTTGTTTAPVTTPGTFNSTTPSGTTGTGVGTGTTGVGTGTTGVGTPGVGSTGVGTTPSGVGTMGTGTNGTTGGIVTPGSDTTNSNGVGTGTTGPAGTTNSSGTTGTDTSGSSTPGY